jgi:hypothetical protein
MSADEELGYVYLSVSTPTNDYYGGHRPGDGLYGESLVCLDVTTGKKVWHYQLIHHGLWDYDPPAAPNLIDITVEGKPIKAVAQVTKQAFVYVFDRITGKPVWPIEQPVPASACPASASKTAIPKPAPFDIRAPPTESDRATPGSAQAIDIASAYVRRLPPDRRAHDRSTQHRRCELVRSSRSRPTRSMWNPADSDPYQITQPEPWRGRMIILARLCRDRVDCRCSGAVRQHLAIDMNSRTPLAHSGRPQRGVAGDRNAASATTGIACRSWTLVTKT